MNATFSPKVKEILLTKARVTTATERGEFTAVISTQKTDREGDVVLPAAMLNALKAWDANGKLIPLAWQHLADDPAELVGHINPASAKAIKGEVVVDGWIDRDTPRGQQVWRLVKSNTLGFSYGYLVLDAVKRDDGAREIRALDIFEVSATATPMNADTRVLGWKATEPEPPEPPEPEVPSPEDLRARSRELERELEDPEITAARTMGRDWMTAHLRDTDTTDGTKTLTPAQLRAKSDALAREFEPIHIASFEC